MRLPMHACQRQYPGGILWTLSLVSSTGRRPSPVPRRVGFRVVRFEACSAFTHVPACMLAKSPMATLYTEGFDGFVTSSAAPITTGWSDQLPGGTDSHWENAVLARRTGDAVLAPQGVP